jgi:hypothetical protein
MVVMWLLYFFNWLNILENTYLPLFRCCLGSMGKFNGEKIWCCCDVSLEEFLRRSLESLVFVGYCSNRAMP